MVVGADEDEAEEEEADAAAELVETPLCRLGDTAGLAVEPEAECKAREEGREEEEELEEETAEVEEEPPSDDTGEESLVVARCNDEASCCVSSCIGVNNAYPPAGEADDDEGEGYPGYPE